MIINRNILHLIIDKVALKRHQIKIQIINFEYDLNFEEGKGVMYYLKTANSNFALMKIFKCIGCSKSCCRICGTFGRGMGRKMAFIREICPDCESHTCFPLSKNY